MMGKTSRLAGGALAAAVLFASHRTPAESRVVLDRQTFERDTTIRAEHVVFAADARIEVKNGARLDIKTKVLEFHGPAFVDGRGAAGSAGAAGATPSPWTSCSRCAAPPADACHKEWERSGKAPGDVGGKGGPGGDGGPGALVEIDFESVRGAPYGVRRALTYDVAGGAAGAGGIPGRGRELRCGCHPSEVKRGPAGVKGPDGKPGKTGSMRWGLVARPNRPTPPPNPPLPVPGPPPPVPLPEQPAVASPR
jgi:hypothetical protein